MGYSREEVIDLVEQDDVYFVRLAFTDAYGHLKNIAIPPDELRRAFHDGISFDASAIAGFSSVVKSDLFLYPIPSTLTGLPWRSSHGKVVRMFCDICYPDGTLFGDSRAILKNAIKAAAEQGLTVSFGTEFEFYLFKTDENGQPTREPLDTAGYFDVAPYDKGENVRRDIVLTLKDMGIHPETSHHEEGPGQNEVDFRHADAMTAADNAVYFKDVVHAVAMQNGLTADFSPKPLSNCSGNGLHINMSVNRIDGCDSAELTKHFMAGILAHVKELTAFLNPTEDSYKRLGEKKAPKYISWSEQNRSQLIRIPAASGEYKRFELRSADPEANPYIVFALLIHAGLDGINRKLELPEAVDVDLYNPDNAAKAGLEKLPAYLSEAVDIAKKSEFIRSILPENFMNLL